MPRRYAYDDTYERDRRDHHDHVFAEDEIEYHRRAPAPPVLERERVRERGASPPAFLRGDYGKSATAGPLVLGSRDREPEHRHRERPRRVEEEEVMYRRPPERERVSPREFEREYERERRAPHIDREYEKEDVKIRRREYERDDYIPRRERPHERENERDEVIIRRGGGDKAREYERERDDYRYRPVSHERVKPRSRSKDRDEEIIIRRDEREKSRGRRDRTERDEVIIRRHEERGRSRSSSPESAPEPPEPPTVRAPPIHQDVITHHKHIDHGYTVVPPPRAPSPDSPPRDKFEEIDIRRRGERDGRPYDDEIIIDRREREESPRRAAPVRRPSPPVRDRREEEEIIISRGASRPQPREHELVIRERDRHRDSRDERDIREEAEYYNRRATERSRIGEAYNGATRDWEIVDVPPGTKRVTMDGVGGGTQDISWQRYNGVRRSKFIADGEEYSDRGVARNHDRDHGRVGRRYEGVKDPRDNLWTEITKDLIVKEAIEKMGYDFEETDYFYYIIAYLRYDDIAALVALSEDLRQARRDRMREIEREQAIMSRSAAPHPHPPPPQPLLLERPSRLVEEEKIYEHDLVIDRERRGAPRPVGRGARW
ncbi:hypothetical protein FQN54_005458 [Arachnomyces sp. PD_36]|nr:hypothetical protein FQN54_005458 [Arachnomyces sp. PD_36]